MDFLSWLVAMRRRGHSRTNDTPGGKPAGTPGGQRSGQSEAASGSPAAAQAAPVRRPLGDLLVERRLVSPEQLSAALEHQQRHLAARKLLGEILIAMTGMTDRELVETLAVQARQVLGPDQAAAAEHAETASAQTPSGHNSLRLLATELARASEIETSDLPEWIREYTQHPEFLQMTQSPVEEPEPLRDDSAQGSALSLVEEVALLHREPDAEDLPDASIQTHPVRRFSMLHGMTGQFPDRIPAQFPDVFAAEFPEEFPDPLPAPFPSQRILVAIGSRPEAIKLAPVIRELERPGETEGGTEEDGAAESRHRVFVCVTGERQEQLERELLAAGVHVDLHLNLPTHGQPTADLAPRMLQVFTDVIREFAPDWLLVQGTTAGAAMASLAAFYAGVRVAHLEAGTAEAGAAEAGTAEAGPMGCGLELNPALNPALARQPALSEAFNRRMIGMAAQMHFAPTLWARQNLIAEGVAPEKILVTGNTGIDALRSLREPLRPAGGPVRVLVSASRREGPAERERLAALCEGLRNLVRRAPGGYLILWPLAPDPLLNGMAADMLGGLNDVLLADAAGQDELLEYLEQSDIVLTDSAALQEDAPSFGKPVLILGDTTDRPEGVEAGLAWLIGTRRERIERALDALAAQVAERRTLKSTANPYGDGFASARIADFFAGREVAEFGTPAPAAQPPLRMPVQRERMELLQPAGVA